MFRIIYECYDWIRAWILSLWYDFYLFKYSYDELVNILKTMPRRKRERFEYLTYCVIYADDMEILDEKTKLRNDMFIQCTLGLSNFVDLYNWLKFYNNVTNKEEAA